MVEVKWITQEKKYGVENFLYEVLFREEFDDLGVMAKTLNEKEMYYIKLFDSFKSGYNMNEGGAGNVGFEMPNDSRLKISENTKHTIKEKATRLRVALLVLVMRLMQMLSFYCYRLSCKKHESKHRCSQTSIGRM